MAQYLDESGLKVLWSKIKNTFWSKGDLDTTFIEVVSELPTTGIKRCLYLKQAATTSTSNNYTEYLYTGPLPITEENPCDPTKWEILGEVAPTVDLSAYFKGVSSSNNQLVFTKDDKSTTAVTVGYATNSNHASSADTATTAGALLTSAGDANTPVYIDSSGKPAALGFTIAKSVPANAVFTDTVYALPAATSSVRGGIKIGTGFSLNGDVLNNAYSLPTASSSTLGGIKVGGGLSITSDGTLSSAQYALPIASDSTLGGIKVGTGLGISSAGVLTLKGPSNTTLGGIKTGYAQSGKTYPVSVNADNCAYVSIPWMNTVHGYCETASTTAAKTVTSSGYKPNAGNVFILTLVNANTYQGQITLDVNGTGAKNVILNGQTMSSSVYSIPAGTYLVYCDGTNYNVRTDKVLPVTAVKANTATSATTATTATKLGSATVGGTTTPIYLNAGTPTALGYTIAKSVPSNAVFTDTHYASSTAVAANNQAVSTTTSALTNGNVYLNHVENGAVKSSHKISGSGATTVTADASGNIIVTSTNTTYSTATTSANGLMSAADKTKLNGIATSATADSAIPTSTIEALS